MEAERRDGWPIRDEVRDLANTGLCVARFTRRGGAHFELRHRVVSPFGMPSLGPSAALLGAGRPEVPQGASGVQRG